MWPTVTTLHEELLIWHQGFETYALVADPFQYGVLDRPRQAEQWVHLDLFLTRGLVNPAIQTVRQQLEGIDVLDKDTLLLCRNRGIHLLPGLHDDVVFNLPFGHEGVHHVEETRAFKPHFPPLHHRGGHGGHHGSKEEHTQDETTDIEHVLKRGQRLHWRSTWRHLGEGPVQRSPVLEHGTSFLVRAPASAEQREVRPMVSCLVQCAVTEVSGRTGGSTTWECGVFPNT